MKAVLQRVRRAEVRVEETIVGSIGNGLLILVCAVPSDTDALARQFATKIANLRIFEDDAGKMNRSLIDLAAIRSWRVDRFAIHACGGCAQGAAPKLYRRGAS